MESDTRVPAGSGFFPAVLRLVERRCLVVGGGKVALRKTGDLLRCGAFVHVVASKWPADFEQFQGNPRLSRSTRPFQQADLAGVVLAIAATDDRATQEFVAREATRRGVPLNVVDVPDLCSVIVPATLRRGSLTISVSTEGKCPGFAVRVRDRLAGLVPSNLGAGLERLAEGRQITRRRFPHDQERRVRALDDLLDPAAVNALFRGDLDSFEASWDRWRSSLWHA